MVQCLPSICEAQGSIPAATHTKNKTKTVTIEKYRENMGYIRILKKRHIVAIVFQNLKTHGPDYFQGTNHPNQTPYPKENENKGKLEDEGG